MITSEKYFAFLALSISSLLYCSIQATIIIPVGDVGNNSSSNSPPPQADCTTILDSPQFAWLCRIPGKLNASHNVASYFLGKTADQVCDGDCRCVMGAKFGRCGQRPSDNGTYCICDYKNTPTEPSSIAWNCPIVFNLLGKLVCGTLLENIVGSPACQADCQCSHGYKPGNHRCGRGSGNSSSDNYYCLCDNGNNI